VACTVKKRSAKGVRPRNGRGSARGGSTTNTAGTQKNSDGIRPKGVNPDIVRLISDKIEDPNG